MKSLFSIHVFILFILLYFKQISNQFLDQSSTFQETDLIPSFHSRKLNQLLQSLILGYEPINSCGGENWKDYLICETVILNSYLIPAELTQIFVISLKMFKKIESLQANFGLFQEDTAL